MDGGWTALPAADGARAGRGNSRSLPRLWEVFAQRMYVNWNCTESEVKVSTNGFLLSLVLALVMLGAGIFLGVKHAGKSASPASYTSFQKEMDAYCATKLNDDFLSKLSPDGRKGLTAQSFFSRKLHTCVQAEVDLDPKDPKNAGAMNYVVTDLTHDFVAPPTWHASESPLHIIRSDLRNWHHLYAEGYWAPVSSDPGQQPVAKANSVKLTCDYTEGTRIGDDSNICTEIQGYTQVVSIQAETQTYHIASWSRDEVIATDVERGLSGATTTTLIIHPEANEVEVIDRTKMDENQPKLLDGMAGKSYGDHYELHGGMYLLDTEGVLFQCDEDGVVTDMRLDVVKKYHGDVVNVPASEWNAGLKADHKFTQRECETAMQRKLDALKETARLTRGVLAP
jgi:hypothetical protein